MNSINDDMLLPLVDDSGKRSIGLAVIFTATIFLSATLLFSVQPMLSLIHI